MQQQAGAQRANTVLTLVVDKESNGDVTTFLKTGRQLLVVMTTTR